MDPIPGQVSSRGQREFIQSVRMALILLRRVLAVDREPFDFRDRVCLGVRHRPIHS